MNVTLKLYAGLSRFLPSSAVRNAINLSIDEGQSVRQILDENNVPIEQCHLILVNGIFVPPKSATERSLNEGDVVAVWPPVAGG